ncbi:hypothetical protein KAU32_09665, partial [bacterium]|nr:hypothetical protein [bacterium]
FKTLLGWSPGGAGLPMSGCGKEMKKRRMSSRGSLRPWDPSFISSWFPLYTSHFTHHSLRERLSSYL